MLAEFDDGKRSCRKRLAGHNERRRKPQVGIHSGRTGKLLQSYNGIENSVTGFAFFLSLSLCQCMLKCMETVDDWLPFELKNFLTLECSYCI